MAEKMLQSKSEKWGTHGVPARSSLSTTEVPSPRFAESNPLFSDEGEKNVVVFLLLGDSLCQDHYKMTM